MANSNNETTTKFKVDIAELKSQFAEARRQIQLANSEFKAATGGMDDWTKSADGLSAKLKQLGDTLGAQKTQLKSLEDQYALVVKEQGENSKGAQDLKIKINNQKAAIGETEKQIRNYNTQLDNLGKETENAKKPTEELSESVDDVNESTDKAAKGGLSVFSAALGNLIAEVVSNAISKIKELAGEVVNVGKQFDASMSNVQAISGATAEQYDELREKAKEMGAETKFTASQTADAFSYMAMAGWKTEDMIDGIDGVLNLAAASGADLATTSDIVTDALTAFGKSADDAGRLADIMAAASSNANTNVEMMGETFKYVAPLAGALNYSMEDTSVAIGLMANSGIKGTQAGTSLRGIITRLTAPTKESGEAMAALGISIEKTNADGTKSMKSLSETIGDLREAFGKMRIPADEFNSKLAEIEKAQASLDVQFEAGEIKESDYKKRMKNLAEQQGELMDRAYGAEGALKAQYASMLAGKNALSGFMALVNASDEDFEKLTAAVQNSEGAAQSMADTMMDNLQGDLTRLSSAFEGFELTLYEKFTTPMRDAVNAIINDVIPALTDLANGVDGSAEKLATGLSGIITDIFEQIVDALPQAINVLSSLISSLANELLKMLPKLVDAAAQIIADLIKTIGKLAPKLIDTVLDIFPDLINSLINALPLLIDAVVEIADGIAQKLPELITKIINALPDTVKKIAKAITKNAPTILNAAIKIFEEIVNAIPAILPQLVAILPELIDTVVKCLIDNIETILQASIQLFMAVLDALPIVINALAPEIPKIIDAVVHTLLDNIPVLFDAFLDVWQSGKAAFKEFIAQAPEWLVSVLEPINDYLIEPVKNAFSELLDWLSSWKINDVVSDVFMSISETVGGFLDWAKDKFEYVWENTKAIFSLVKTVIPGFFKAAWEIIKSIWDNVVSYFKMIWENIKAVFSVVKSVLSGDFSGAWDGIKKIWDNTTGYFKNVWENVKNVFSVVKDYFKSVFSAAWEAVKQAFVNVGEFFGGIWDTITDRFKTIGSAIGDAIGGAFKTAINAVIGTVERGLNVIPGIINDALDVINELPGVDISPMSDISLPRLARGGVLKRGQLGLLEGSGAEAVVPLEKNTRWLDEIASRIYDKMSAGGNTPSPAQGVVNNFYQTNNSPKALSRLEIYRQSKNLLRMQGG
jgi:TP901 family phage tail tape measure protein